MTKIPDNVKQAGDRKLSKKLGVTVPQLRIIRHLQSVPGGEDSYAGIEKGTGYYSILTGIMRKGYEASLCDLGIVKETIHPSDNSNRNVIHFKLTPKGLKLKASINGSTDGAKKKVQVKKKTKAMKK